MRKARRRFWVVIAHKRTLPLARMSAAGPFASVAMASQRPRRIKSNLSFGLRRKGSTGNAPFFSRMQTEETSARESAAVKSMSGPAARAKAITPTDVEKISSVARAVRRP